MTISAKQKDTISKLLQKRLKELTESMSEHDKKTTVALPKNSKEALPVKEEIEIVEAIEKHDSKEILLVSKAIEKLTADNFGACEGCGEMIGIERLLARPWSSLCVQCQEKKESQ